MSHSKDKTITTLSYAPFVWSALVWCAVAFSLARSPWVVVLWFLSMIDLLALTKLLEAVSAIYADANSKATSIPGVVLWGTLKIGCLGLFAVSLFAARGVAALPLTLGLGTLVVVPLTGGVWWSLKDQKGLTYAR